MTVFDAIELLFPVVLGIHTWDELRQRDRFVQRSAMRWAAAFVDARTLAAAAALLMVSATTVSVLAYASMPPAEAIVRVAIFALLFNAIGHVLSSLAGRKPVPGTVSAVCLVLPYTAIAIALMHAALGESTRTLLAYAALGLIAMPLAALAFLLLGYLLAGRRRTGLTAAPGPDDASC